MTFEEYRLNTLKAKGKKRKSIIKNSHTMKEIWEWINANKWFGIKEKITKKQFGELIRCVHTIYADKLCSGSDVVFPLQMGSVILYKVKTRAEIKEGKIRTGKPVDWSETLKLWYEDKTAKEKKILVRRDCPLLFKIKYCVSKAKYKNKMLYTFRPNRGIKKRLSVLINNNEIDAYQL